jgi:hypothetical protein
MTEVTSAPVKAPPTDAEPAGAARFTAASYPNTPIKTVASDAPAPLTIEERLTALEAVVHAIAPYSRNAEHGGVKTWIKTAGARLKADAAKVKKAL